MADSEKNQTTVSVELSALTGDAEQSVVAVPVEGSFIQAGSPHAPDQSQGDGAQAPLFIQFVTEDGADDSEMVYELVGSDNMEEGVAYLVSDSSGMQSGTIANAAGIKIEPGTSIEQTVVDTGKLPALQVLHERAKLSVKRVEPNVKQAMPKANDSSLDETEIKQEMDLEEEEADDQDVFECPECFVLFFDSIAYEKHLVSAHYSTINTLPLAKPKWFCTRCKTYMSLNMKKKHKATCQARGKKDFSCDHCDETFFSSGPLERHKAQIHGDTSTTCDVCNLTLSTKRALQCHMRRHTGERPFKCTECGKSYTMKESLNAHIINRHTTARPFQCHLCEKAYKERSMLQRHIQKCHMNVKRHFCSECGKGFFERKILVSHFSAVHTEARPFKCQYCDVAYKWSTNLDRHMKSQHTDQALKITM